MSSMGNAASRVRILEASGKGGTITIHFLLFHKICRRVTEDKRYGGQVPRLSWRVSVRMGSCVVKTGMLAQ